MEINNPKTVKIKNILNFKFCYFFFFFEPQLNNVKNFDYKLTITIPPS